jgi:hypothetical protein
MSFFRFWICSGIFISFVDATYIPSIVPIAVLDNPMEISILSMKIEKSNSSWVFLQNIWEDNPELINLYGTGLRSEDHIFQEGPASLWNWNQLSPNTNSKIAECFYIPSSKYV